MSVKPPVRRRSRWARALREFAGISKLNLLGMIIVALAGTTAILGLLRQLFGLRFTPYDPLATNLTAVLQAPSLTHPMGTDHLGRDLFSRVLSGASISLEVAVSVLVVALVLGVLVGLLAGFFGGLIDEILMRVTDLFLAFPALILAAAISATFGASLFTTILALGIVWWPWYARLVRSQVLSLREQEFVLAARSLGATRRRLLRKTLLPNVVPLMIVQATLDTGFVMLAAAGLSFLGLGAQPPQPEWGSTILASLPYQPQAWWYATFPGLALATTALGFNLLGDGLRDWLDPSMQGVRSGVFEV